MDPEIKVTSAAEAPEIESASATKGPEIDHPPLFTTESSDCIFRASARIRYGRESDFEPKLVSIGPYYHGRENLKRMEDIKVQCMSDFLKMRPDGGSNIDRVPVDPFMRFESNARRFYKEKFDLSDDKFVEMLVLDSCFVIRIMVALSTDVYQDMAFLDLNIKEAVSDLLLLENQIPLFFIEEVFYWLFNFWRSQRIFDKLLRDTFIQLDLPWWIMSRELPIDSDHLLHLYWKISEKSIKKEIEKYHVSLRLQDHFTKREPEFYKIMKKLFFLSKKKKKMKKPEEKMSWKVKIGRPVQKLIANATELHQMAGINFENVKIDRYNGGCVEFSKGIMRMPCLKIDSSQTTLLINLIAFENSLLFSSDRTISTYIKIMDDLIDSDKDVELLQRSGVVYNTLSSHAKAATFFNDVGNLCLIDYNENPFSDLFKNVNKYYKSRWNRSYANLRQNYFNSPWAGISVFAGVTLLFLAGTQTYYTVFPKK